MKKNVAAKVFAWLALLGIVTSIIGTGILYFYETRNIQTPTPSFEDYLRNNPIQIDPNFIGSGAVSTGITLSGNTINE